MAEKSTQEIPRALRDQFDRGMAAYHKDNLDYAITLFTGVLQKEPAFYECREALRAAQVRKGGAGGGLFRRLLGQASPLLAKGQLALRSNPAEAMHCAELTLNDDPKSSLAHELLARAAMASGLPRTAVLSLEIVFKAAPADRGVAMRLAQALVAAGQTQRADRIYADLLAANPADLEVARAYKDLGARRTMTEQGYSALAGGQGSYRDVLKDKEEATSLEQESRHVRGDEASEQLLADYQARLLREPDNLRLHRRIADLHVQRGDLEEGLSAYRRIAAQEGRSDPSLEKVIAEIQLRRFDQRLSALDPADPDYAEKRTQLETERSGFALEDCRARVERYPTDLTIRFEFGRLLFENGQLTEAIQELQRAQANPHRRIAAMGLLARCFTARGMHDLAARTLQNALKEKPVFDEEKKELTYELGCVLERLGQRDSAAEQFKLIYETDIGFRDVAARVDAYYAGRSRA